MGTVNVLGVAAAVGRLIGLDAAGVRGAVAIAASSSAGIRKNFGTFVKPLHAGQAAFHGVQAAELAAAGFVADDAVLDGRHGFVDVFGDSDTDAARVGRGAARTCRKRPDLQALCVLRGVAPGDGRGDRDRRGRVAGPRRHRVDRLQCEQPGAARARPPSGDNTRRRTVQRRVLARRRRHRSPGRSRPVHRRSASPTPPCRPCRRASACVSTMTCPVAMRCSRPSSRYIRRAARRSAGASTTLAVRPRRR